MTLEFKVLDMACSACAMTITNAITAIDPDATVEANPKTKQVKIATQQPEKAIQQAIVAAGYTIT